MTEEILYEKLKYLVEQGACFNYNTRDLLMDHKTQGGKQDKAQQLVEQLAAIFENDECLQDRAYDILDIVTGWCGPNFLVWDRTSQA